MLPCKGKSLGFLWRGFEMKSVGQRVKKRTTKTAQNSQPQLPVCTADVGGQLYNKLIVHSMCAWNCVRNQARLLTSIARLIGSTKLREKARTWRDTAVGTAVALIRKLWPVDTHHKVSNAELQLPRLFFVAQKPAEKASGLLQGFLPKISTDNTIS